MKLVFDPPSACLSLKQERNMNARTIHGSAKIGDLERVRLFIEADVSVDSLDDHWKRTPLHWAARGGQYEVAEFLISRNCIIDPKDPLGRTPVMHAATMGHKCVVDLLVQHGAQVNCTDYDNYTLLHLASGEGLVDIVRHIIEKEEADVNAVTNGGVTPLMKAAMGGNRDVAALLIRAGADINRTDLFGVTALQCAAHNGQTKVVQLLLEEGGLDLNLQDINESLSVYLKVGNPRLEAIKLFIQHGAFFEDRHYENICENPFLKENILKVIHIRTRSAFNKFSSQTLPVLYSSPYFVRMRSSRDNLKLNTSQEDDVKNFVRQGMQQNTFYNIVRVCLTSLSARVFNPPTHPKKTA